MDFPTPPSPRPRRPRLAAGAPWVAAAFLVATAAARAEVHGGIEIGSKGVKAAVVDATGGADGFHVQILMSGTKNTTLVGGLASTGRFDAAALKDTAAAVADFADQMRKRHMVPDERIYVVGSSGLLAALGADKDAVQANRQAPEDAVRASSGLPMTFIDARREVELSLEGTVPEKYAGESLLLDVGSGNTKGGYRDAAGCVSVSVPYGSVTFADLVKSRSEKAPFAEGAAALREEVLAPALKKALADKPELAKRERVYLSGGAAWALATLVHPGDRGDYVALTAEDVDAYRALLRKDPTAFPPVDLSGVADAAARGAAEKEIAQVKGVFKPEQLIAGAELLKGLADAFEFGKGKKVFFARDAQVGWILAYVAEKAGEEMTDDASVTFWLDRLRRGDRDAAQPLWERYFDRLVRLARQRLHGVRRTAADEEDVALSAFDSFCRAAEQGRFPRLNDRDDLWHLLVAIAERKAIDLARRQQALKHGGGRVVEGAGGLAALPDPEPTPDFAALVAEECQRLLRKLGDERLRAVALLKMEGYGNGEIAGRLDCGLRTIERKLALIREAWEEEGVA